MRFLAGSVGARLLAMACLVAILVVLSFYPFAPLRDGEGLGLARAGFFAFAIEHPVVVTLAERAVLLAPVGYLLGGLQIGYRRALLVAGSLAVALSLTIGVEFLQLHVVGRHGRLTDAAIGLWCFYLGFCCALLRGKAPCWLTRAGILVGTVAVFSTISVMWVSAPGTGNWLCSYPWLLGDEKGGGRHWTGEISGAALYARHFDDHAAAALFTLPFAPAARKARDEAGALWLFSGEDERGRVRETLPLGPTDAVSFLPPATGKQLCEAVRRADAVSIEVKIRAGRSDYTELARILTMSGSQRERNVTLGQIGSRLDLRLRTFSSGTNGEDIVTRTAAGVVTQNWQHVLVTYGQGWARFYVDGVPAGRGTDFSGRSWARLVRSEPGGLAILVLASALIGLAITAREQRAGNQA